MIPSAPVIIRMATVPSVFGLQLAGQPALLASADLQALWVSSPPDGWTKWPEEIRPTNRFEVEMKRYISPLSDLIAIYRLIQLFKKINPSIVHTHSPKAGLVGMIAAWFCGVPVRIHTLAGTPLSTATGFKKKLLFLAERITAACSTQTWVIAPSLLRWGLQEGFLQKEKASTLLHGSSNGVDLELFDPARFSEKEKQILRANYEIPEQSRIWLFVGRLVAEKGIVELLQAFQKIQQQHPNQILVFIGPLETVRDPIGEVWEKQLHENPEIRHIPWSNEVSLWMALASALIHPSYREGFPNVLLEAGAMKCPVIVSAIDGNIDLVNEESMGYLFPVRSPEALYHCMERFIADGKEVNEAKTERLYQDIHQYFDRKKMHEEILRQYRSLYSF